MAEDPPEVVGARELVGLLAADDRLKAAAALVLGATSTAAVAEATGLDPATAVRALERLRAGGLAEAGAGGYRLRSEVFREAAKAAAPKPSDDPAGEPVLRRFLEGGRLKSIPSSRAKRLVVLDYLAQLFEPGRRYPEAEINATLLLVHPDTAALRRYLVDEEFMERADGVYWRAGGTLEVD